MLYKKSAAIFLKRTLLSGADTVWALDATDDKSRAIVNVLIIFDGEMNLEELNGIVKTKLLPASKKLKLFRSYSSLGYFYWEQKVSIFP